MNGPTSWLRLQWQRPLEAELVTGLLRQLAADPRDPVVVLETRWAGGTSAAVRHYARVSSGQRSVVLRPLRDAAGTGREVTAADRPAVSLAARLRLSTRHRPLRLQDPESVTRALYGAGSCLRAGEQLVLQVVLGPHRIPLAIPNDTPAAVTASIGSLLWRGTSGALDGERRSALRQKVSEFGFACSIRLGVVATSVDRRRSLLLSLFAALRVSEAPGVQLRVRSERPGRVDSASSPFLWPLRLSVVELMPFTGWPLGDGALPGLTAQHPRRLPAPRAVTGSDRVVADSAEAVAQPLALPVAAATHHLHVVGPTGTGKSTLLANLILQDIAAGRSVVVIEPKGDLVMDVLARTPKNRWDDIVVIDPSDAAPVGLNPLRASGKTPELTADSLLSVMKQLYGRSLGPRSADILYASMLSMARREDASLVMLPLLLTNAGFRHSVVQGIRDPLFLEPFWAGFERWSDAERAAATGPVLNKLRPLIRPGLRGILGQREPRFTISQVFTQPTVLLAPLRRGVIGADAANLLGAMLVSELWQAVQGRSRQPAAQRHPVLIYIDEAQNYLHLPTDIADALAQARGYGVGFILAHQFLSQFSRDMQRAVLANARSRIVFQVPHADAKVLEQGYPELSAADFTALGQYQLYASLFAAGTVQPYAFGTSRPLPAPTVRPDLLLRRSQARYGRPLDEVEAGFAALLQADPGSDGPIGQRPRRSS